MIYDDTINSLFEAAADSVDEAIYNSLCNGGEYGGTGG